ncbi:sensor histidine kinase [Dyella sp.]|uniref:sensor histidine kinase n=1 Tax=Dyella sp. TaxID=1869338 RepID=UPI002ED20482
MGRIAVAIGSSKINFLILVLWLALAAASSARADARPWTLDRYQHSTWTTRDGAPVGVTSLTQTKDGFIWVGSSEGLFRFDGLRFQHIENIDSVALPKLPLMTVFASADGGLWLGYSHGPIFEIKGDTVAHVSSEEHGPVSTINSQFVDSPDGGVWASVAPNVMTFDGKRWIVPDDGFREILSQKEFVTRVLVDRNGNVWAGTLDKLLYRPAHSTQFMTLETSNQKGPISEIVQSRDGSVWICYTESGIERWDTHAPTPIRSDAGALSKLSARGLTFDSQGNAWLRTQKSGIEQIPASYIDDHSAAVGDAMRRGTFDSSNGLSSDTAWALLVDREDNLWVGTSHGIDRFSRSNFARSPFPQNGSMYALAAGRDGSVWAGMQLQATQKLKDGHLSTSIPGSVEAVYAGRQGNIYLSQQSEGNSFDIWVSNAAGVKLLTHSTSPSTYMSAIVEDSRGVLWGLSESSTSASFNLFTLHGNQWVPFAIPKVNRPPSALYADDKGRVWYGYLRGSPNMDLLGVIDDGKALLLGADQGVTIGSIGAFMSNGRHLWVGGSQGLGFMDGMRMHAVRLSKQPSLGTITGIAFAANGDMWIHAMSGVYRISERDVAQAENDASHALSVTKFDGLDGLPGPPDIHYGHPTVVKSTDGRLWFATINGVVWLDPAQLVSNPVPPSISITKIVADDTAYSPHEKLAFPALTRNLDVEFSVLSFSTSERVDAKVRLLGFDADWKDLGTRREVSYSNLAPGAHQLDIAAFNSDGVRGQADVHMVFYIKPAFYQTLWFKGICALVLLVALWLVVALRIRQLSRRLHISLEAKHKERESIARELHDTLLQGMQGLLMQMEFWARRSDLAPQQRDAATEIEEKMRDVLIDGRDKIRLLRQDYQRELDLVSELLTVGQGASANSPSFFSLRVEGEPLPVCQEACVEIFAIAREAILNAYRHADADHVVVTITYEASALSIAVSDDGFGIDRELMEARQRAGHWGISGMHERAEKINALLQIETSSQGTTIRLITPKRHAYLSPSRANSSRVQWWRQQRPRRHKTDKASA